MIKEWLQEYQPRNQDEAAQALREIMQEVALAGLYRAEFFKVAAFYGGTALRIFYQLPRFSEDLDFSLLAVTPNFSLEPYLPAIEKEFEALGMHVSIREKKKTLQNNIESAFLKSDTLWKELVLKGVIRQNNLDNVAKIKIKIEVDKQPPLGFDTEEKLLLRPFSFYVKLFVLRDLFAGKMHALLFRKWQMNVKGRDWFDMEWYISRKVPLDLSHFILRARDSGDWANETMTEEQFRKLLSDKIDALNLPAVIADISRFIPNPGQLNKWNRQYFHDLASHLIIEQ